MAALRCRGPTLGVARFGWTGRYTVLYRDGRPDELAFWGISGD